MGFLPFNVDDKTDPTGILLVPRVVQSLLRRGNPGMLICLSRSKNESFPYWMGKEA